MTRNERTLSDSVILTGTTGLVGREVATYLAESFSVYAIGRRPTDIPNVRSLVVPDLTADLRDLGKTLPKGAAFVHCAAAIQGEEDQLWAANVEITRRILQLAASINSLQFVHFSTSGVYGYLTGEYISEETAVNPIGVYGYTKYISENLVAMFSDQNNINADIFRLYFPFSDRKRAGLFKLIPESLEIGLPLTLNISGAPRMQPVHCGDVAEAIRLALINSRSGCNIYNLCGDEVFSFKDLVLAYSEALGVNPSFKQSSVEVGDLLADNSRLKKDFGWEPRRKCSTYVETVCK